MEIKKSPEADLEKKRGSLLAVGLLFTFAVTLSAFELTSVTKQEQKKERTVMAGLDDETIIDMPTPPPPVAPPPPPQMLLEIEVKKDNEVIEEVKVNMETEVETEKIDFSNVKQEEEVVEEEIFKVVEKMPSYPGGEAEMFKYLQANLKYPPIAKESGIQGKVYIRFLVEKDGSIARVEVLRGVHPSCDEEAMRVVKNMPKWQPGEQRGKPVRVWYTLPVHFKLN
jgi:protein TonB